MGRRKAPEVPPWKPPTWLVGDPADNDQSPRSEGSLIPGIGLYADAEITVRPVRGSQALKRYDCPICNQAIAVGTPHTVVVPNDAPDHRRHFHTACWRSRHTRRPGRS